MKLIIALRISLLLIALSFLASCASKKNQPVFRSSVPEHCNFQNQKRQDSRKLRKAEAPPSRVTPIGGNFRVRS